MKPGLLSKIAPTNRRMRPDCARKASTTAQVLAEHRQINVARHCPLPSHDMAKVRCRPQISHGRAGAIPLPLERGCETVKVWSAWPAPQMPGKLQSHAAQSVIGRRARWRP